MERKSNTHKVREIRRICASSEEAREGEEDENGECRGESQGLEGEAEEAPR